jgi:hypothetical protein
MVARFPHPCPRDRKRGKSHSDDHVPITEEEGEAGIGERTVRGIARWCEPSDLPPCLFLSSTQKHSRPVGLLPFPVRSLFMGGRSRDAICKHEERRRAFQEAHQIAGGCKSSGTMVHWSEKQEREWQKRGQRRTAAQGGD